MTPFKLFYHSACILWMVCISSSCAARGDSPDLILVGSTPGDDLIKSLLAIPPETKIDFIKWNLALSPSNTGQETFVLGMVVGESQPNTLGFIGGGKPLTIKGTYRVSKEMGGHRGAETVRLTSESLPSGISLAKLNDNLFHLLTPERKLMIGNGGWSYSLNRKYPVPLTGPSAFSNPFKPAGEPSFEVVFDGRTPCREIAAEHPEMNASPSCFKLKWRLILHRDSVNHLPTTFTIRKVVDNEPRDVTGTWTILKGIPSNPDAVIYLLDPDKPAESISFLAGDENVLFFLNRNHEPYIGNEDFSFTMNRRIQ